MVSCKNSSFYKFFPSQIKFCGGVLNSYVYSSNPSIANLKNCDKHVNSSFYNVDLANEFSLEIEKLVDDDSRSSNNDEIYTKENFLDFLVKSNKIPYLSLLIVQCLITNYQKEFYRVFAYLMSCQLELL